jgi:hypothetical protein
MLSIDQHATLKVRGEGLDCRALVKSRDFDAPATSTLRNAQNLSRWRSSQQCREPQVLSDGAKNKLVLSASRAAQPTEL